MGGCASLYQPKFRLSPELEQKVLGVFRKMDVDGSKSIDKGETVKFWFDFLIFMKEIQFCEGEY